MNDAASFAQRNAFLPVLSLLHFDLPPQTQLESVKGMSINSLPVETLEQIFSSNLKQVDLARLCQVSKLFLDIVRPLLYRSITLRSITQTNQCKNSREEDARLVREIHIVGKGNLWKTKGLSRLEDLFQRMDVSERSETEAGVVKRLLEGEIVNPRREFTLSVLLAKCAR